MSWIPFLIIFSILQNRFYEIRTKKLVDMAVSFWALMYLELCIAELIRQIFVFIDLEWWIGVGILFAGFLVGELGNLLFEREGKIVIRRWQALPSFFTFCSLCIMLIWVYHSNADLSFASASYQILALSASSVLLSVILAAISDRLLLSDVPKTWQGLPALLITGLIILIILSGVVKNFLP